MYIQKLFLLGWLLLGAAIPATKAQIKIGSNAGSINSSAILEMETSNKGLLLPRVALTAINAASPLAGFVTGMAVYNTATAGSGVNAITPGCYYCDGSKWVRLITTTTIDPKEPWRDAVTCAAADSTSSNIVYNKGNIGINTGTTAPTAKLEVDGTFKLADGTQGTNRALVSDASGLAHWMNTAGTTVTAIGNISSNGVTVNGSQNAVQTGSYIDLGPGKWLLNVVMLVSNAGNQVGNDDGIWIRSSFSNSTGSTAISSDIVGSWLISGSVHWPMRYGLVTGLLLINNTSAGTKRYYYFAYGESMPGTSNNYSITNFGSTAWGEDQIFALPIN